MISSLVGVLLFIEKRFVLSILMVDASEHDFDGLISVLTLAVAVQNSTQHKVGLLVVEENEGGVVAHAVLPLHGHAQKVGEQPRL